MPIKPRDFLDQSQRLIKGNTEVDHRSAVSRAYYCALHSCIQLCRQLPNGFGQDASSSHEKAITQLIQWPTQKPFGSVQKQCVALGISLRKGKKLRVHADYKLGSTVELLAAKQHLSKMGLITIQADNVLQKLKPPTKS